jgi:hypothetical protein
MRESKLASRNWVPDGALTFLAGAGRPDLARWNPAANCQPILLKEMGVSGASGGLVQTDVGMMIDTAPIGGVRAH